VILGSANINDRSQTGKRDSELAVLLMDTGRETATLRDRSTTVNPMARKLRMDLWKKHLAFSGNNGLVQSAAGDMSSLIEKPAAGATIDAIQDLAKANAATYEKAFPFVPWSSREQGASLWPVCPPGTTGEQAADWAAKMPFDERFWLPNAPAANAPSGIKGHFVKLPLNWTLGENNHPSKMSVMAVADAGDVPQRGLLGSMRPSNA